MNALCYALLMLRLSMNVCSTSSPQACEACALSLSGLPPVYRVYRTVYR